LPHTPWARSFWAFSPEGKHKTKTETAQRLLAMGLSAEQVAKATQLPLEIIKK
jgi:predicted transposase YdaD